MHQTEKMIKLFLLCLIGALMFGTEKVIIWDNDGTIMGSKDPSDKSSSAKVLLPNVEKVMKQENTFNVICSGMKTPESELQNFNPEVITEKFKKFMIDLPVSIATFSPAIGGAECWVIIKNENNDFSILKAHEDKQYQHLISTFKKPGTGMLTVIKDLLQEKSIECNDSNTVFVGDAWQDMIAAHDVQLPFLHAGHIHAMQDDQNCFKHAIHWRHGQELIVAWKDFFNKNNWQDLIMGFEPIHGGCGLVYELPNFLQRPDEGLAIVDMRHIAVAEPHYHPDLEVYFVLQGEVLVIVGTERYSLKKGDVVSIPPFKAHYAMPNSECIVACINTPPYTPGSYIPLQQSNAAVAFDYARFKKDVQENKKCFEYIRGRLNRYIQEFTDNNQFSGLVFVAIKENILLNQGYGFAHYEKKIPINSATKFRIASLTKQFTAAAILRLQEQGLLHVSDSISRFIPDFPNGDEITLHHLLTHSSGIANYTDFEEYWQESTIQASHQKTIARFKHKPVQGRPGGQASYNNSAYVLLAYIIELITKQPFIAFLTEHFFEPLGMYQTGFACQENRSDDFAIGYCIKEREIVPADNIDMMQQSGAGFLYSTGEDLYKWHKALQNKRILSDSSLTLMSTPYTCIKDWAHHCGYGVFLDQLHGKNRIYHHGGIKGFMSTMTRFLEDDVFICVLGNVEKFDRNAIVANIAKIIFEQETYDEKIDNNMPTFFESSISRKGPQ